MTTGISLTVVGSIIFFFVLEKFIHLHHQLRSPGQGHIKPVALNNLIGDGIHNFVDGAISAGAFIYIAGADLIPEMHDQTKVGASVHQFVGVTGGFAAMAALLLFE